MCRKRIFAEWYSRNGKFAKVTLSKSDLSQMFVKDSIADDHEDVVDVLGVGGAREVVVKSAVPPPLLR